MNSPHMQIPRNDKDAKPASASLVVVDVTSDKARQILADLERDRLHKSQYRGADSEGTSNPWYNTATFPKKVKKVSLQQKARSLSLANFKRTVKADKRAFLDRLTERDGHWEWLAGGKYPRITVEGRSVRVQRFSFEAFQRATAEGEIVIRTCGNTRCCRPNHLKPTHRKALMTLVV